MKPLLLVCGLAVALAIVAFTQDPPQTAQPQAQAPPAAKKAPQKKGAPPHQLTADEKRRIEAKADELAGMIQSLESKKADDTLLADVEIYQSAARMILEHPEEFFSDPYVDQTLTVLDAGLERARQLAGGNSPWIEQRGRVLLGYRSEVDGSVQPYGVIVPQNYDGSKPLRADLTLHGRLGRLNEVNMLATYATANWPSNAGNTPGWSPDDGQFGLDPFGRMNNAFNWAGEADVFETLAAASKRFRIDQKRVVLKGFSMGSASAWFIGMHMPGRFASLESGSGASRSRRFTNPDTVPVYQRPFLKLTDNIFEWSINLYNLPTAGYGGEDDPQRRATVIVYDQLVKEGFHFEGELFNLAGTDIPFIFNTAPKTGHMIAPESRKVLDTFHKKWADRGLVSPDHIRFKTYTARYNESHWVTIDGLEKHYEPAEIEARRADNHADYQIATKGVARLLLRETGRASNIDIDGQKVKVKPAPVLAFEKTAAAWKQADLHERGLHKRHGMQGPIDDAFLEPFLCVKPTGTPWNAAANAQALRELAHFDRVHSKYLRGHVRVKDDRDVTEADLKKYHVVLFGDPGSNKLMAKVAGKLPVKWTRQTITLGDRNFASADNIPALIYPNPLNPAKYVVLNSGLTVEDRDYQASDYLTPRLGDFAIIKIRDAPGMPEPVVAGVFDESWRLPKEIPLVPPPAVAPR
jgi:hypothetical protein